MLATSLRDLLTVPNRLVGTVTVQSHLARSRHGARILLLRFDIVLYCMAMSDVGW